MQTNDGGPAHLATGGLAHAESGHVHLQVDGAHPPKFDHARWLVAGLGLGGAILLALSYLQTWWSFILYAPQYPKGLKLTIALTGMGGDVHEIDLLNHYIGMAHLEGAAQTERHLAAFGVAVIASSTMVLVLASGKRLNKIIALPALAFPIVFLADSFYWLYSFGHHLDPHAPLRVRAFTPQLFGNGQIAQFETYAEPGLGFWLACAGLACVILATVLRTRVCAYCENAANCRAACPRLMILPRRKHAPEPG